MKATPQKKDFLLIHIHSAVGNKVWNKETRKKFVVLIEEVVEETKRNQQEYIKKLEKEAEDFRQVKRLLTQTGSFKF